MTHRWWSRRGAGNHIPEQSLLAVADADGRETALSVTEQRHLADCRECEARLARHTTLTVALRGEWGILDASRVARTAVGSQLPRQALVVAVGSVLAVVLAVNLLPLRPPASGLSAPTSRDLWTLVPLHDNTTSTDLRQCADPARRYGETQVDFAELYILGARIVASFTSDIDRHVTDLRSVTAADCAISVRLVPYSSRDGRGLQRQIEQDVDGLQADGIHIVGVGFDPVTDKVVVTVTNRTPAAVAELERRYPKDMLSILEGSEPTPI